LSAFRLGQVVRSKALEQIGLVTKRQEVIKAGGESEMRVLLFPESEIDRLDFPFGDLRTHRLVGEIGLNALISMSIGSTVQPPKNGWSALNDIKPITTEA